MTDSPSNENLHYETLPDFVQIGPYQFIVELVSHEHTMEAGYFGFCDYSRQVIRVSEELTPNNLANTMMHEVMHGIHWVYGVSDASTEEQTTEMSANGLCKLAQDNPEFMQWWLRTINTKFVIRRKTESKRKVKNK